MSEQFEQYTSQFLETDSPQEAMKNSNRIKATPLIDPNEVDWSADPTLVKLTPGMAVEDFFSSLPIEGSLGQTDQRADAFGRMEKYARDFVFLLQKASSESGIDEKEQAIHLIYQALQLANTVLAYSEDEYWAKGECLFDYKNLEESAAA